MNKLKSIARSIMIMSALSGLCGTPVFAAYTDGATASTPAKSVSKLGDLGEFRTIAVEAAGLVEKGNLDGAKARIKDLETSWDEAEAGLKPRSPADWRTLDKAIDKALAALRASSPTQADCKTTMSELLKTFDSLQGNS